MNDYASNYSDAYESPSAEIMSYDTVDILSVSGGGWTPPSTPGTRD